MKLENTCYIFLLACLEIWSLSIVKVLINFLPELDMRWKHFFPGSSGTNWKRFNIQYMIHADICKQMFMLASAWACMTVSYWWLKIILKYMYWEIGTLGSWCTEKKETNPVKRKRLVCKFHFLFYKMRGNILFLLFNGLAHLKYCRVPARWGLQQTTRAPSNDKTRGQGSFGPFITNLVIATYKIF